MAETAVQSPNTSRFFCHKCTQEIRPVLPEFICPQCQCGFIEELAQRSAGNISEGSDGDFVPFSQVFEHWNIADALRIDDLSLSHRHNAQDVQHSHSGSSAMLSVSSSSPSNHRPESIPVTRRQASQEIEDWSQSAERFLQQLTATLAEGGEIVTHPEYPVLPAVHSNPGDYAWGMGGFDAIMTQLQNQLDDTGVPPLSKDKIEKIPSVLILQDQVDKNLQCTVCMEYFIPGEPVKKLSCEHHFHRDCITPWLELHGTCPICRKLLNDDHFSLSESSSRQSNNSSEFSSNENRTEMSSANHSNNSLYYTRHSPSMYDFTVDFNLSDFNFPF